MSLAARLFFTIASTTSFAAGAAEPVGAIERLQGKVEILDGNSQPIAGSEGKGETKLRPGFALRVGQTVRTGPDARVLLVFKEGRDGRANKVVLGAGSQLLIETAVNANDLRLGKKGTSLFLQKGEVRSAVEARYEKPGGYRIRTANAVAGVRGTRFFVAYDPARNRSDVAVTEGEVEFSTEGGAIGVKAGLWGFAEGGAKPSDPLPIPAALDAVKVDVPAIEANWAPAGGMRVIPPRSKGPTPSGPTKTLR